MVLAAVFAVAALVALAVYLLPASSRQMPSNQQRDDADGLIRDAFALPESVK